MGDDDFFRKLKDITGLEENIEGIMRILGVIYRTGTVSVKEIARRTRIPVPVVAKVVNILIDRKMLARNPKGVQLYDYAMKYLENEKGFYGFGIAECPKCGGRPFYITPRIEVLYDVLTPYFTKRPVADTSYDQSKITVETAIQRALYMYEKGALEGKSVAFLGDDDFTSVAVAMLYRIFFPEEPRLIPSEIIVFDIDRRILDTISSIFRENGLEAVCVEYDARQPLPDEYINRCDTVVTDPPYSLNGLKLFLSRAVSILDTSDEYTVGKDIFLSFAHRSSVTTLEMQKIIIKMGLAIMEIIPSFNRYEGSEVLANETAMWLLKTTGETGELIKPNENFDEKIYTGETHPYIRKYRCKKCGNTVEVGQDREFITVEELIENGCPQCGRSRKFEPVGKDPVFDM